MNIKPIRRFFQRRRRVWFVDHPGVRAGNHTLMAAGHYALGTYREAMKAKSYFVSAGDTGMRVRCQEPEVF